MRTTLLTLLALLGGLAPYALADTEVSSLAGLLSYAEQTYTALQAEAELEQARLQVSAAQAAFDPQLELSSSGGLSGQSEVSGSLEAGLSMSTLLHGHNAAGDALRSAERNLETRERAREEARREAELELWGLYLSVWQGQNEVRLAEQELAQQAAQLEVVRSRLAQQDALASSLAEQEERVLSAQTALEQARMERELARLEVSQTAGLSALAAQLSAPPFERPEVPSLARLLAGLEARADVRAARASLATAQQSLASAQRGEWGAQLQGGYQGTIGQLVLGYNTRSGNASATYSYRQTFGGNGPGSGNSWNLSVGVSVPISDGGANRAAMQQAEISLESAQQSLIQTRQRAELDIRRHHSRYQSALAQLEIQAQRLSIAALQLETARARLAAGTTTTSEVEGAELARSRSELDYQRAAAEAALEAHRLLHAAAYQEDTP